MMLRDTRTTIALLLSILALATGTTEAQQASGIAGVVRDTSGAVLPGVTVEASSPALIEQVRTVTTDAQGRYSVVDLRTGTYSVTFRLPGFGTVTRAGVELTAGFTAAINVELPVGAVEETVTVTGASPLVDTQNVTSRLGVQLNLDAYNALNSSSILLSNSTFGAQWRRPNTIIDPRILQFSGAITF